MDQCYGLYAVYGAQQSIPYVKESRHLHAMSRARGVGGHFLNTKNVDDEKTATLKVECSHINQADHSPSSELLDSNSGIRNSGKEVMPFGSTSHRVQRSPVSTPMVISTIIRLNICAMLSTLSRATNGMVIVTSSKFSR